MTHDEALHHVLDGARQHRDALAETGRLDGVADLLSEAIHVVETHQVVAAVATESRALAAKRRMVGNRPWEPRV